MSLSHVRAGVVVVAVGGTACLAATIISASPAEAPAPPKATEAAQTTLQPVPEVTVSARPDKPHTDRSGPRKDVSTPSVAAPKATPTAETPERPKRAGKPAPVTITYYKDCTGFAQKCIDAGTLTKYGSVTPILAGHNYDGYQWLSRVPVGKRVTVTSGPLAGTYEVYGHMRINRQGGAMPNFGNAALVLQSCEGSGTGFSLLRRA